MRDVTPSTNHNDPIPNLGAAVNQANPNFEVIDDAMADVVRCMTPSQKLRATDGLVKSARMLIAARIRADHPEWSDEQVRRETARVMLRGAL